jgi:hypothetical protein
MIAVTAASGSWSQLGVLTTIRQYRDRTDFPSPPLVATATGSFRIPNARTKLMSPTTQA